MLGNLETTEGIQGCQVTSHKKKQHACHWSSSEFHRTHCMIPSCHTALQCEPEQPPHGTETACLLIPGVFHNFSNLNLNLLNSQFSIQLREFWFRISPLSTLSPVPSLSTSSTPLLPDWGWKANGSLSMWHASILGHKMLKQVMALRFKTYSHGIQSPKTQIIYHKKYHYKQL